MSWLDELDFEVALNEVIRNQRRGNDFILDPLRFEDLSIERIRNLFINNLKETLKSGGFRPQELMAIDIPKSNFILRPGARPNIEDLVVYQACTNFLTSRIHRKIRKNTSYSFNRIKEKYKKGSKKKDLDHWIEFDDRTAELCKNYKFLLTSDITSFFEHISHEILKQRLLLLNTSEDYSKACNFLIDTLLEDWTQTSSIKKFSLPQGPDASRILADIYLYYVDKKMKSNSKIVWFRYMDDLRLFAKTKHDLKIALIDIVTVLRDLKLNLNAKKTSIFDTEDKESLQNVIDPAKSTLTLIDKAFKSRQASEINLVYNTLFEIYEKALDERNPFSDRHLNFFISHCIDLMKFGMIERDVIKSLCLAFIDLLEKRPHLTNKICWFLLAASRYWKEYRLYLLRKLISFIKDRKKNIYAWQELVLLDTIRQLIFANDKEQMKIIRNLREKHILSLCQKNLILGKGGDSDDLEEIVNQICGGRYKYEQLRSIGIAIQQLNRSIKRELYDEHIHKPYIQEYVKGMRGNKYYGFMFELQKEDIEVEGEYPF